MKKRNYLKPLEDRVFVYKNPAKRFFCPLCRTKRNFTSTPRLNFKNYLQIFMTTLILVMTLFPLMQWKGLFMIFLVWMGFELCIRFNFKKQIPCEHCGFDASWYHRDIPTTRRKVAEFWEKKEALKNQNIKNDDEVSEKAEELYKVPNEDPADEFTQTNN